eukprot:1162052-Pelagomonas_calceolata.AAC.1
MRKQTFLSYIGCHARLHSMFLYKLTCLSRSTPEYLKLSLTGSGTHLHTSIQVQLAWRPEKQGPRKKKAKGAGASRKRERQGMQTLCQLSLSAGRLREPDTLEELRNPATLLRQSLRLTSSSHFYPSTRPSLPSEKVERLKFAAEALDPSRYVHSNLE